MKIVLTLVACFFITVLLFLACSKPKDQPPPIIPPPPPPVPVNQPPVARAGADTTITLSYCTAIISVPLDASKSSDPENKIISYFWRSISGPQDFSIRNGNTLFAKVDIRRAGVYSFELLIVDLGNLTSKDTVTITVVGASPKPYDLDITSNTSYKFYDNILGYYSYSYMDYTEILGNVVFVPLGTLNIEVYEETDSADFYYATSYLAVSDNNNTSRIYGSTSINFKKLIQQGGGAFNGNYTVTEGSAKSCDTSIYKNLAPLLVTGNLDTTTKKVSIRIKGKVFF